MFKKLLAYFKIHGVKVLIIGILGGFLFFILALLYFGMANLAGLEAFSRKQMMAMMGIYLLIGILQAFIFVGLMQMGQYFFMSGGLFGRFTIDKTSSVKANVKWDEIIGMDNAKKEAWEIVKLLKDRHLLKAIGGKIIKGTLMIGPPGCGKTYLVKAIATECGLPLIPAAGSEFVGIFIGLGASKIKSLFKQAREMASIHGGCIIFIDEIDSFARPRMADMGFGGGMDHNATINQFLTELDGLRQKENNIVVLAATNVSEHDLDPALMRAGRFERKVYITRPNLKERKDLFDFYLKRVKTQSKIDTDILSRKCLWFTPADIDAMVREAGLIALRESRDYITMKDLSESYDRVTFGAKSNIVLTEEDKKWTAYHEAGHAIMAYLIHPKDDVIKATIIPRKNALGLVSFRPSEESYSYNKEYFLAQIKISIASYAAEKIIFNSTTSGVGGGPGSDFNTALSIAQSMVWSLGMGKSGLIGDFLSTTNRYGSPMISQKTQETLDHDVQDILQTCLKEVEAILHKHRDLLDYFAQELLKKEELEYDEIIAIFDKFGVKPMSRIRTSTTSFPSQT